MLVCFTGGYGWRVQVFNFYSRDLRDVDGLNKSYLGRRVYDVPDLVGVEQLFKSYINVSTCRQARLFHDLLFKEQSLLIIASFQVHGVLGLSALALEYCVTGNIRMSNNSCPGQGNLSYMGQEQAWHRYIDGFYIADEV